MHYIIIMAGGEGTRLWPVSRRKKPKQVQPFLRSNETLLQKTFKRIKKGFKTEQIYLTTIKPYYQLVRKQLPKFPVENISVEPQKKDTAAAIGLIAAVIYQKDPKAIITTVSSDAYVENEKEYLKVLKLAAKLAKSNPSHTILIGINPSYSETGYGYIQMDKSVAKINKHEVFNVKRFIEKPNLKTAQNFLQKWEYLWNPALFTWSVQELLKLYQKYLPSMYKGLVEIEGYLKIKGKRQIIEQIYKKIPKVAIEYAILEKTKKLLVIPADFVWADIGHWRAIKDVLTKKTNHNLIKGEHIGIDVKDNLIYSLSGRLVATAGLRNMIIVDTPDALLVCSKDKAHKVKDIINKLRKQGKEHLL
jgi:mannose-1-phosphate guanylyltransferase